MRDQPLKHGDEVTLRIAQGLQSCREILTGPIILSPDESGHRLVDGVADHKLAFRSAGPLVRHR